MKTQWNQELSAALADIRAQVADHPEQARSLLSDLIAQFLEQHGSDFHTVQEMTATALFLRDFDAVGRVVGSYFPSLAGQLIMSIGVLDPPDVHIVHWTKHADGTHHFRFSSHLFARDFGWVYMIGLRWCACLHLVIAAAKELGREGRTYLDMGDWSSNIGLCFSDNRQDALLVPDSSFLGSDGYWAAREWGEFPWAERQGRAIWRGSPTGMVQGSILQAPRVRLCSEALGSDGLIDAGLTSLQDATEEEIAHVTEAGMVRPHVPMPSHSHYKLQIDVDGNTNSWPGLFQKLLTGSPVLKVLSQHRYSQWYYPRLIPWQNYVPIASDLSDLLPIATYLLANDELARSIGAAGRELGLGMTVESEAAGAVATIEASFRRSTFRDATA